MPCSIHTQVYTLKSRFKASRLKVRPRYKVLCLILMVKIEFQMIKSSFDWKSRLNAGPRPDRSYTSNRDFTVHALKDEFVMKLNHVLWETFECKEFAFLCLTKKVEASCESASKIVSCVNGWAWMNVFTINDWPSCIEEGPGRNGYFTLKGCYWRRYFLASFYLSQWVPPGRQFPRTEQIPERDLFIAWMDISWVRHRHTDRHTHWALKSHHHFTTCRNTAKRLR